MKVAGVATAVVAGVNAAGGTAAVVDSVGLTGVALGGAAMTAAVAVAAVAGVAVVGFAVYSFWPSKKTEKYQQECANPPKPNPTESSNPGERRRSIPDNAPVPTAASRVLCPNPAPAPPISSNEEENDEDCMGGLIQCMARHLTEDSKNDKDTFTGT